MKLNSNNCIGLYGQGICVLAFYDPNFLLNYIFLNSNLSYFIVSLCTFSMQAILIFLVE